MEWQQGMNTGAIWCREISNFSQKSAIAELIATKVKSGDIIGVGSGSTSFLAIQAIGKRVTSGGFTCRVIPTSFEAALACAASGLTVTSLVHHKPDWCFDGADEIDPAKNLIKGRGGAMFLEKLVLRSSGRIHILADSTKMVQKLGERFPIPIEVQPVAFRLVTDELFKLGAVEVVLRLAKNKDGPVISEHGNVILDARFHTVEKHLESTLKSIPGVIESGLFWGYELEIITNG